MCGIIAIINLGTSEFEGEHSNAKRMLGHLQHRGPDRTCIEAFSNCILGATRLSIIDINNGSQPITDDTGRFCAALNGEIYNYKELRLLLEQLGYRFRTNCDTEVLLYLFIHFGKDCIKIINGMFVFVVWDNEKKEIFFARDRYGIKPCFYTELSQNRIIIASEIRSLLSHSDVQKEIDIISLQYYLSLEFTPSPRSIIKNIFKLPSGHYATFSKSGLDIVRYWNANYHRSESKAPVTEKNYINQLDQRIYRAVELELNADVPVGILLSGGLDSSTIAYYATRILMNNRSMLPDCYSVSFNSYKSYNELSFAKQVCSHLGLKHHVLELKPEMTAQYISEAIDIVDEPFADSSIVPTYALCKFASREVRVVLGGDGGDELFAGYPTYQAQRFIKCFEFFMPFFIRSRILDKLVKLLPVSSNYLSLDFKLRKFLSGKGSPIEVRHYKWLGAFSDIERKMLMPQANLLSDFDAYAPVTELHSQNNAFHFLNKLMYCDSNLYLQGNVLAKLDTASMAASVEARVPFLNNHLVSFVNEIPVEFKLRKFCSKYILKKLMSSKLPSEIVYRKKHGFAFPLSNYLTSKHAHIIFDRLKSKKYIRHGLFSPQFINTMIDEHINRKADHSKKIWSILVFNSWYDKHF